MCIFDPTIELKQPSMFRVQSFTSKSTEKMLETTLWKVLIYFHSKISDRLTVPKNVSKPIVTWNC